MLTRAREHDAERIASLHIASWRATYGAELSPGFLARQDLAEHATAWRRRIAEGVAVLIADEDCEIVGFVACGPEAHLSGEAQAWEIYNLHVAPNRRGEGFGSQLFDAALRLGQERGACELLLWVVRTNSGARAFYERKGMRWDGGEQEHGVGPEEKLAEVRYRMNLAASEPG